MHISQSLNKLHRLTLKQNNVHIRTTLGITPRTILNVVSSLRKVSPIERKWRSK